MDNLILIRHGQSLWNKENRFTGWVDVDLSEQGIAEAKEAGEILKAHKRKFDVLFTSRLMRANRTAEIILDELGTPNIETHKSWRLNERHYGGLQGKNKKETAEIHGDEQVHIWRRSYDTLPPELEEVDTRDWGEEVPDVRRESLKDTYVRVLPYWKDTIEPVVKSGKQVLVAAHGNSLRALMKHLFDISDDEIVKLEIPTGKPIVVKFDENYKPIKYEYLT